MHPSDSALHYYRTLRRHHHGLANDCIHTLQCMRYSALQTHVLDFMGNWHVGKRAITAKEKNVYGRFKVFVLALVFEECD